MGNNQTMKDPKCQVINFELYLEGDIYIQISIRDIVKNNLMTRAKQLHSWKSIDITYTNITGFKVG